MEKKNGVSIAGMVLGIISCICFCLSFTYFLPPVGLVAGVIGLVLSITGRKANVNDTFATVGLVLSIIGIVLCAITTVTCTICYGCAVCEVSRAVSYYW